MKAIKKLLPMAVLIVLAACGDDSTGSDVDAGDLKGTVAFSYQGGGEAGGSFQASGAAPGDGSLGNWAGGLITSRGDSASIGVTGTTRSGSDFDMTTLVIEDTRAGSYSFGEDCGTSCAYGVVVFGIAALGDDIHRVCTLASGELHLTSVSTTAAKGTFSGTGTCVADGQPEDEAFTVAGGTFDVKLAGR